MKSEKAPYSQLGDRLKELRAGKQASAEEVSGAVEIEPTSLAVFESGSERPSEDILMLLINYFDMQEDEAATMWRLADYEVPQVESDDDDDRPEMLKEAMQHGHTAVMMMAFDPRVIYSDGVDVTANQQGVILNFTQSNGSEKMARMPISRIGMSYEQAKGILEVLQKTLDQAEGLKQQGNTQKRLPPETPAEDSKTEN